MIEKKEINSLAENFLEGSPNYLVDIAIAPGNAITIEIDNDNGVNIDDCAALSRHIESKLNRNEEDFELTVASAGLTSPFKTLRQYKKYEGKEIEVLTKKGEKLHGRLLASSENDFTIEITKKEKPEGAKRKTEVKENRSVPYEDVKYTKYRIKF